MAPTVSMRVALAGSTAGAVDVASCRVHEQLGQVTEAELDVVADSAMDVASWVQQTVDLAIAIDDGVARRWSLVVGDIAFAPSTSGAHRYRISLFSPFWLLTHTLGTRKFRNLSAQDIVSSVLSQTGVAFRWQITRTPPVRKYCVQYRESHHDFVNRLLESEGIYHSTDGSGVLVLEDNSTVAAPIDGDASLSLFAPGDALAGERLGVWSFGAGARVSTGRVTVNDYSWKTPQVELLQSQSAGRDTELERYMCPAGYRTPDQGAYLARVRLEAARARTQFVGGMSNVPAMAAGRTFSIEGGSYLLTAAKHHFVDPRWSSDASDGRAYRCRFEAIDGSVPFRMSADAEGSPTVRPTVHGCHTVRVRGPEGVGIHTDKHGRFRAQFHWDREAGGDDTDSRWLRKLQETSTSMNLARVGWEVSVAYIDGDPDRPIGLAREINGVMPPSYSLPANKQLMTIKTPTYPGGEGFNEIKLDDRAGAMRFDMRAERDLTNRVLNDKALRIRRDHARVVVDQLSRQVTRDQRVAIDRDNTRAVAGDTAVVVAMDRDERIGGDEKIRVNGNFSTSVAGNDSERVGSLRLSLVGQPGVPNVIQNIKNSVTKIPSADCIALAAVKGAWKGHKNGGGAKGAAKGAGQGLKGLLPKPKEAVHKATGGLTRGDLRALAVGAISRTAIKDIRRSVGGIHAAVSAEAISTTGKYALAETVGGAKLTAVKGAITQKGGLLMALTVGGLICRKSAKDITYSAKSSAVNVGGIAMLDAGQRIDLRAATVTLEAATTLTLKTTKTEIELTPTGITLKGPLKMEAKKSVTFTSSKENLTSGESS